MDDGACSSTIIDRQIVNILGLYGFNDCTDFVLQTRILSVPYFIYRIVFSLSANQTTGN